MLVMALSMINLTVIDCKGRRPHPIVHIASPKLSDFEGKYELQGHQGVMLQIQATEDNLILKQLWNKEEIRLDRESEMSFIGDDNDFSVVFNKNRDGAVSRVLIKNKDMWNKVKE